MPIKDINKRREYARRWIAKRRAEYFKDKVCARCGSRDNLEIDHINPETKVDHKIWSWSQARRDAELMKCQVLCEKHHNDKTIAFIKMTSSACGTSNRYKDGCRCPACREATRDYMRRYRVTHPEYGRMKQAELNSTHIGRG
jgi:hypothetical protein